MDAQGRVLGRHRGVIRYTVGQRRGLGVSAGRPLYVQRIDAAENRVVLCGEEGLYTRRAEAEGFNWIAFEKPPAWLRAEAKLRAGHGGAPAEVWTGADGRVRVEFDEPQRAVTPGQALVLYRGKLPKFRNLGEDGKPHMIFNWFDWKRDGREYPKIHPSQKPISVLKRLIETFTDEGDVVIDPCAGSGSTLRAARELGRNSYGFEVSRDFYRKANEQMLGEEVAG